MSSLKDYLAPFPEMRHQRWFKIVGATVGALALYDLLLSQLIPQDIAKRFPRVADMMGGWLPWWAWFLMLETLLVAALVQQLVSQAKYERIPMIEIFKQAQRLGTDLMGDNPTILTICASLRQAGVDGTVKIWGRQRYQTDPLVLIPAAHWIDYQIDWMNAFVLGPPSGVIKGFRDNNNYFVGSYTPAGRRAYYDLHVDKREGVRCIKTQLATRA